MASQLVTNLLLLLVISLATKNGTIPVVEGGATTWCVARSDTSELALQMGLDYACGSVADCDPIQPSGLCYLPNIVQSHTSYALNSYYQRKANAPGRCDFNGTATTTTTDPSLL
ncbi:hypothetical protein RHSIM_Rhsim04G0233300 [Rhododendron simsii]|uniref:X8 domain-containing protein n=1 Tax=Rhododendron simsii TaxID=118357 RepID=A0A834H2B8_RHOSS|nr:hypothetical protein RHSIM_Rhsim04G0233300 [Rhododendron simsii]